MPAAAKGKAATNGAGPPRAINLDEKRAARAEQHGEPVVVTFGGKEFSLPVEMPAEFAFSAREGDLRAAVEALFGDQSADFMALHPSVTDITELAEAAAEVYGVTTGG